MATKFESQVISRTSYPPSQRGSGITTTQPIVTATRPRKDGKGSETSVVASFGHGDDDQADAYAAELKRETRGKKAGGIVSASSRADGCAQRGKTKGRMV